MGVGADVAENKMERKPRIGDTGYSGKNNVTCG
jgi:hypothetical protein